MPDPISTTSSPVLDPQIAGELRKTLLDDLANTPEGDRLPSRLDRDQARQAAAWLQGVASGHPPKALNASIEIALQNLAHRHDKADYQLSIARGQIGRGPSQGVATLFVAQARDLFDPNGVVRVDTPAEFEHWVGGWGGRPVVYEHAPQVDVQARLRRLTRRDGPLHQALNSAAESGLLQTALQTLASAAGLDGPLQLVQQAVSKQASSDPSNNSKPSDLSSLLDTVTTDLRTAKTQQTQIGTFLNRIKQGDLADLTRAEVAELIALLSTYQETITEQNGVIEDLKEIQALQSKLDLQATYDPATQRLHYQLTDGENNLGLELFFDEQGLISLEAPQDNASQKLQVRIGDTLLTLAKYEQIVRGADGRFFLQYWTDDNSKRLQALDVPALTQWSPDQALPIELAPHAITKEALVARGPSLQASLSVPRTRIASATAEGSQATYVGSQNTSVDPFQQTLADMLWHAYFDRNNERSRWPEANLGGFERDAQRNIDTANDQLGKAAVNYLLYLGYDSIPPDAELQGILRKSRVITDRSPNWDDGMGLEFATSTIGYRAAHVSDYLVEASTPLEASATHTTQARRAARPMALRGR